MVAFAIKNFFRIIEPFCENLYRVFIFDHRPTRKTEQEFTEVRLSDMSKTITVQYVVRPAGGFGFRRDRLVYKRKRHCRTDPQCLDF